MSQAIGWLVIIAAIAVTVLYVRWLKKGVRPRQFTTTLSPDAVRDLFATKVARAGWTIVDDGNPMVAQSSLITGIRQQIGLSVEQTATGTSVDVRPLRLTVKTLTRVPTKAHTLRIRMDSFVTAARAADPALTLAAR